MPIAPAPFPNSHTVSAEVLSSLAATDQYVAFSLLATELVHLKWSLRSPLYSEVRPKTN